MKDQSIERERAQNLWASFTRKSDTLERSTHLDPLPDFDMSYIGGLAGPKEEILTYGLAATNPKVYARWGTFPPSGMLLIGDPGVGKNLLAKALSSLTQTSFLRVNIPRLVIEVIHHGGKVGELMTGWSETMAEMPPVTVFFEELEFSQAQEIGARRPDLPIGPVMDFLLDLVDRTIAVERCLVVGSTSHPDTLRQAFNRPGRFERIVEVTPEFPSDIVAALQIHAGEAENRAGHSLFDEIDWNAVVGQHREPSTGDWVRILQAVLRLKAHCEAAGEPVSRVTTHDLQEEVTRFKQAHRRLALPQSGNYL